MAHVSIQNSVWFIGVLFRAVVYTVALFLAASTFTFAEAGTEPPFLFSIPNQGEKTTVTFDFEIKGINYISSIDETFEFIGVMTLVWKDPRVAFDPNAIGVPEIIYQGDFQFNEVAAGWYPQVVLDNDGGTLQRSGVQLRILPDGTSTLKEKIVAVAEMDLDMRRFPFDAHHLEAQFSILGHDSDEIDLRINETSRDSLARIKVPEWQLGEASIKIRNDRSNASLPEQQAVVLKIVAARESFFVRRLVTIPMAIIVLLSSSIFWMEKSSLSDRNSVSFVGILTAVAYQQIIVDVMPPVSYFTFMHGMLLVSFIAMSATVPVNFIVAAMDKRGRQDLGDRIDHIGKWLFPLIYILGCAVVLIVSRLI